jgi:hypothetical protein
MIFWVVVTLMLLPVKIFELPHHVELVDCWIILGLPVVWTYLLLERQSIHLSYTTPMWVILIASLASTYAAPKPSNGIIVILKEIYLFAWFVTLIAILCRLSAANFRRVMLAWTGVAILHGALIIAQFLSPEFWRLTTHLAGGTEVYDNFRAAGLFIDPEKAGSANKASFFQLFGFIPLLLAGRSARLTTFLGLFLFGSMLATGSMGGLSALLVGLVFSLIAMSLVSRRHLLLVGKFFLRLTFALALLGIAYFAVSYDPDKKDHLENIVSGRAERSSEGRFTLWERGMNELLEGNMSIWGIGPENFRVVDWLGKQLHNDLLAFTVERGLLGALGLVLFGVTALRRAIYLLLIYSKFPDYPRLEVVVFLGGIMATFFESLTHQVFHAQQLWLLLAVLEAMLIRVDASGNRLEPRR